MNPVIQLKQINSGVKLQLSINLIELYSEQKSIQILHELLFFIVLYNSENTKKNNQNLPGMGGIFNHINSNLYHYGGNNPVKYTYPDGRALHVAIGAGRGVVAAVGSKVISDAISGQWSSVTDYVSVAMGGATAGAILAATGNGAAAFLKKGFDEIRGYSSEKKLPTKSK